MDASRSLPRWPHVCRRRPPNRSAATPRSPGFMMAEALPVAEMTFRTAPWYPPGVGVYAGVLTRSGNRERGHEIVRSLGPRERYGVPIGWALFHATCGDLDSAAEWFARAIEERYSMVGAFLHSAICGPLRSSRHWLPLARLMNLPV